MNRNPPCEKVCRSEADQTAGYRHRLVHVVDRIVESCENDETFTHIHHDPIPSVDSIVKIIETLKRIIFPGYFSEARLDPVNLKYSMGQSVSLLFDMLSEQVANAIRHNCFRYGQHCSDCHEEAQTIALEFLNRIPDLRVSLSKDVKAIYKGDPSANGYDEIIFSYPGLLAITIFRIAHLLYGLKVPILPRTMTEYAHSITGIDIHPAAHIGESFFIDHGTGIVIGETTHIEANVRVYQGVTLGALSLPMDAGERMRGVKRHPTIEEDVIIYSGATILGGQTVIGARSVIGGNVWITKPVEPDTMVLLETPNLVYRHGVLQ